MRNKLKLSKKCDIKEEPRSFGGETSVLSKRSCSSDEASPETESAADMSYRKAKPFQRQTNTFSVKGIKIAPLFLHAAQRSRSKGSSDVQLDQPAEKLQKSVLPPLSEHVQPVRCQQRLSTVYQPKRKWSQRGQFPPSALHSCLEEVQTSNPPFPVQAVFSTLQRKASVRLQDVGSTESSQNPSSPQHHVKEKRKRASGSSDRTPKRLRCRLTAEAAVGMGPRRMSPQGAQESSVLAGKKQPRSNKLSRTGRLRRQSGIHAGLESHHEPQSGSMSYSESDSQSLKTSDVLQTDSSFEDVLWTDKYSPQHSREVIGNSASVNKLQSWLKKWKLKADCDERRKMGERKQGENSSDSWDCGDFQGEAGAEEEELLCNTVLITGPPGVGKTAAVYACSQELGFKVFEVNCSSQRSGCHVLSQLKEATQSHLVETSGNDPWKPTYFNNYSCTPKSDTLPGKTVPPKNVTSTSKKRAAQNLGRSSRKAKPNPAAVTLTNYFKMKAKGDHLHFGGLPPSESPDSKKLGGPSPGSDQAALQNKKTATSLILFEEVDVIFDGDVGFLAAIKTFMTTTKRPVILTTSDPSFTERFNCSLEEIVFKTPSAVNVCSYLQLVGLAENVRLESDDVGSLLRLLKGDVRRCLLQLQLWVNSGGGRASRSGGLPEEPTPARHRSVADGGDCVDSRLPLCDVGCTASMLGLHPVAKKQLLNLLMCQRWSEIDMAELLQLLADSWRGGVPLLYSNLDLLLPVRAKGAHSGLPGELEPFGIDPHIQQLGRNACPKADGKSIRNISRLSRRKYVTTTSSSSLTESPQRPSSSSRHKAERNTSKSAVVRLDALIDFFDLMSYLDATVPAAATLVSGSCRPGAFVWMGAEIKDGLLDEMREEEEEGGGRIQETLLDIQAAVEGLGCHRCWTEPQNHRQELGDTCSGKVEERLTASSKRQSLSFSLQPLCAPSVAQRRYELSRTVLGSKSYSLLGNRQAVSVDYMPVLRYICRSQRRRQQKQEPLRCPNYLHSIHPSFSKPTIQLLAEEFS